MTNYDEEKPPLSPDKEISPTLNDGNDGRSLTSSVTDREGSRPSSVASPSHQRDPARDFEKTELPDAGPELEVEGGTAGTDHDTEAHRPPDEYEDLPPAVVKPKKDRRGIFSRFCVIDEVTEPQHYSRRTKWFITAVVSIACIAAPIGTNIILSSLVDIGRDLNSTPTVTNLSIALYMVAIAICPIFWSSFSEAFGRRSVYVISFGMLIVFNILSAVSVSMPMFLVARILSGAAGGSVQAVGAGTIADIWHVRERGNAMAMYYLGPLMGPLLAPIIGGALQIRFGWRSTMWCTTIYSFISFVLLTFCLPETIAHRKKFGISDRMPPTPGEPAESASLGPTLSRTTTRQSIKDTGKLLARILNGMLIQPFAIVQYLQFPPVLLTIYYAALTFGCLYMLQISIQDKFSKPPYNFTSLEVGLTYIPASLGYAICSLFAGRWTDYVMAREARKAGRRDANGRLIYLAEDRMRENVWTAAIVFPSALIWWGWTAQKGLFWLIPSIANFLFGLGCMIVFSTVTTMLTEFMPKKAASAIALNNLCRMLTAAVGIVVAQPLFDAIDSGWTFTAIGIIAFLSSASIAAMRYYGPKWRRDMDRLMKEKGL